MIQAVNCTTNDDNVSTKVVRDSARRLSSFCNFNKMLVKEWLDWDLKTMSFP